jgi:putative endonuclease
VIHSACRLVAGACLPPAVSVPEVVHVQPKDVPGGQGKQLTAELRRCAGVGIPGRNYRCADGETGIVAAERRVLVASAVMTGPGVRYGTPIEAITCQKLRRRRRPAVRWAAAHGVIFDELRAGVVGVLRSRSGADHIEHVRGVG